MSESIPQVLSHPERQQTCAEFARRLQDKLNEKGWNQSELARRASKFMPHGKALGRDSVSNYVRGNNFPSPIALAAICKALGTIPTDLVPTSGRVAGTRTAPETDVTTLDDGDVFLRVNQRISWQKALKVLAILKGEDER